MESLDRRPRRAPTSQPDRRAPPRWHAHWFMCPSGARGTRASTCGCDPPTEVPTGYPQRGSRAAHLNPSPTTPGNRKIYLSSEPVTQPSTSSSDLLQKIYYAAQIQRIRRLSHRIHRPPPQAKRCRITTPHPHQRRLLLAPSQPPPALLPTATSRAAIFLRDALPRRGFNPFLSSVLTSPRFRKN